MKQFLLFLLLITTINVTAQTTGSFTVGGDLDKYYPTVWNDLGWPNSVPSVLEIGRSSVHENDFWRGSLMAKFTFHTTRWGHGAHFIDADLVQAHNASNPGISFVANWRDASVNNGSYNIIIWLKGGGTTYYFKSMYPTTCVVYDGVANALPFQEENGPAHTFLTAKNPNVNSDGMTKSGNSYFLGSSTNYFAGNLGVGTLDTKGYKFAVAGSAIAESVTVKLQGAWPDYVFDENHELPKLSDVEQFIKANKHLPEIPSASTTKKDGIDVGDMNAKLLKKVEELTLYIIELNKRIQKLEGKNQ